MKKKILAAVMAATMVFSLVACGSSDAGSNAATGSANAATGSANAATESASAGTTSSSSSGDMIKVGIINNDPNESGYLELTSKEVEYVNGYLVEYNILLGRPEGTDYFEDTSGGMVHLNGPQALAYCRNRYIGTDFGRTERQRKVLAEVIHKLPQGMLTNPQELIDGLMPNLTTNLTQTECYRLSLLAREVTDCCCLGISFGNNLVKPLFSVNKIQYFRQVMLHSVHSRQSLRIGI